MERKNNIIITGNPDTEKRLKDYLEYGCRLHEALLGPEWARDDDWQEAEVVENLSLPAKRRSRKTITSIKVYSTKQR